MTAKHKHHSTHNPSDDGDPQKEEKLFDFDKNFGEEGSEEESSEGPEVGQDEEVQSAISELKEKHLRLLAEFDNYKNEHPGSDLS